MTHTRILLATIFLAIGALALPASADHITATELNLVDIELGLEIGQTGDDPCVIGDSSCTNNQPSGLGWTNIGTEVGNDANWDLMSPDGEYDVTELLDVLGRDEGTFVSVGIDVNKTGNSAEILDYFQVVVSDDDFATSHLLAYYGSTAIGSGDNAGPRLADAVDLRNGTGWSDWLLQEFDLADYEGYDVKFYAGMEETGGGLEQFFLSNDFGTAPPTPVPGPSTLLLLGTGAAMLGLRRRQRR